MCGLQVYKEMRENCKRKRKKGFGASYKRRGTGKEMDIRIHELMRESANFDRCQLIKKHENRLAFRIALE